MAGKFINKFKDEPRIFLDGETVTILRPNLWSGCSGEVVGFKEGLHHVRVKAKPGFVKCSHFSVEAPGSELEAAL